MKKIPTIFVRDWDGDRSRVLNEPTPGCEWVFAGEGVATRKFDGTACRVDGGTLWKRYEVKAGKDAPAGFVAEDHDDETGKTVGWVPVTDGPEDRWYREALAHRGEHPEGTGLPAGTYELIGPKIQGNPERYPHHALVRHGDLLLNGVPRDFAGVAAYLASEDVEGIVWHHPDGRMAKVKGRDFGIRRGR